ncbi:hypothetical protein [Bradyrhizobium elkanii]|uniref:hypothetical protein n=1 Tax=Bradyrhizobium elkanii TaxID=29448 RepID=UPI0014496265|nr:hypothetical protein [Bradyrhizobium elkanii]MCS3576546.1 hypothetical protein [Bradyrhizobium elkanii]MCS3719435.1 hypothetical protein [Bradyrhizobium elkanii]MCS4003840.1 hypothetical protein [Bradyrhizobium elkanii USDA 61]BBB99003.1 hypothetical protein BE61_44440 [Bradyrhizobium elkanii USDA 61]
MSGAIMQRELQRLFIRDGLMPKSFAAEIVDDSGEPVILEGIASTGDRDLEHCRFAPYAFGRTPARPPLLYDHDPEQIAGMVDDLRYEAQGRLLATVTAHHPTARRCSAFSVGAKIREYTIQDNGSGDFEAVITRAELTDLSLVPRPVNPACRVLSRRQLSPPAMFWHLMHQRVAVLQRVVALMGGAHAMTFPEPRGDNK